jgi:hypothetical protein
MDSVLCQARTEFLYIVYKFTKLLNTDVSTKTPTGMRISSTFSQCIKFLCKYRVQIRHNFHEQKPLKTDKNAAAYFPLPP